MIFLFCAELDIPPAELYNGYMDKTKLIEKLELTKINYLIYRGSSFDADGNLLWAKDDATAYAEGIDAAIKIIKDDMFESQVNFE